MKKIIISSLFISALAFCSCNIFNLRAKSDYCRTVYPVVLVHGIAFRDKTIMIKYWGDIPGALEKNGASVYTGGQDAYGTIAENALTLKKNILTVLAKTGGSKVNIVAHSRGGIEARYMISMLGMEDRVASLTTVATPHRGSTMADIIMKRMHDSSIFPALIDFYAKIIGDESPSGYNAGTELTTAKMKEFNLKVRDSGSVYYQSYAGAIDDKFGSFPWRKMYDAVKKYEGENDGLVSVDSAKWGKFRGVVKCGERRAVSHSDIIGMHFLTGETCFDEINFYKELVHELKMMGY